MLRDINDPSETSPNLPEPIPGWENYGSAPAHVKGTVNADLSAVITVTYADGVQVSTSWPATAAGPIGPMLVLGNSSAFYGPHFFDNLVISSGPRYSVCPLYDPTKAVNLAALYPSNWNSATPVGRTCLRRVLTSKLPVSRKFPFPPLARSKTPATQTRITTSVSTPRWVARVDIYSTSRRQGWRRGPTASISR